MGPYTMQCLTTLKNASKLWLTTLTRISYHKLEKSRTSSIFWPAQVIWPFWKCSFEKRSAQSTLPTVTNAPRPWSPYATTTTNTSTKSSNKAVESTAMTLAKTLYSTTQQLTVIFRLSPSLKLKTVNRKKTKKAFTLLRSQCWKDISNVQSYLKIILRKWSFRKISSMSYCQISKDR